MTLSEIGLPGQQVDVLNGGDVDPDGRLLSVAEVQEAFRQIRARQPGRRAVEASNEPPAPDPAWRDSTLELPFVDDVPAPDHSHEEHAPDTAAQATLDASWLAVLAAHAGAGASTVALALADAIAATGRIAALVDTAPPLRSGLVATTTAEYGADATGAWRRGVRAMPGSSDITLDRRAGALPPQGWPAAAGGSVVVDLGQPDQGNLALLGQAGCRVVVVCRLTVPGVRLLEQTLAGLPDSAVVVAAVGNGKWPGHVVASQGPRLRALRADRRVVAVPIERRLEVTGPTNSPLPKSVLAAGRAILGLIDGTRPDAAAYPHGGIDAANERNQS